MARPRIMVVDDEASVRASLRGILEDEGFEVETAAGGEECLARMAERRCDLILLDVWLSGIGGLETLEQIRQVDPEVYVIMISGHASIEVAVKATKLGAFDFIEKPLSYDKTMLVIRNALRQKQLAEENRSLREQIYGRYVMIGESVPMRALRQQISFAAPTDARVLIYGENGTGKELVARLLHANSRRRERRFVEVNCAAIPEELIESELFGHVRGAFTGATSNRKGKFEQADQGTLFLDEVGDMSLKTQAKVLRALEEQRFEPVGGNSPVSVDVRVIAATNKDLEAEIEAGNFREDLFFRLNVIPFYVPPLRERIEDIPLLANYFLEDFSRKYGRGPKRLSDSAMELLVQYSWPGNVRELKNMIERLVIMTPREEIQPCDLPDSILGRGLRPIVEQDFASLDEAREAFERQYIARKIRECNGNISRAAEALGIERSSLYRKMKQYGLS